MVSTHWHHPDVWVPQIVEDHFNARYIAVAGLTLMIWTHLTTLDEEIESIWNNDAGLTLNKALFAVVRYVTTVAFGFHCLTLFLPQPSFEVCQGIIISVGAAALGLVGACDLILLLRTWAIYDRTRKSLIYLGTLLAVTHLPTLVLGARWMTTFRIGPSKLYPVIPGCFLRSTATEEFWRVTFPSVVFNTVLSGASIYKIWTYHRTRVRTPLMSLLVLDGMIYYVIILTVYLCNGFFLFYKRLVIVTIEGRFVTWVVAVTCAQLQLNLRTAVHHAPDYDTTCHQQQATFEDLDGRLDSTYRPGVDTLDFGGTTTEYGHKHGNSSIESGVEQGERTSPPASELATTLVHITQRSTGTKKNIIIASTDFGAGKQASPHPQLGRVTSLQGSPSHSLGHGVDDAVIPNAGAEGAIPFSPMRNAHSVPSSGSVPREYLPPAKTTRAALSVDSRHNLAVSEPTTSSRVAMTSYTFKEQNGDNPILLHEIFGIPSPANLETP